MLHLEEDILFHGKPQGLFLKFILKHYRCFIDLFTDNTVR